MSEDQARQMREAFAGFRESVKRVSEALNALGREYSAAVEAELKRLRERRENEGQR